MSSMLELDTSSWKPSQSSSTLVVLTVVSMPTFLLLIFLLKASLGAYKLPALIGLEVCEELLESLDLIGLQL